MPICMYVLCKEMNGWLKFFVLDCLIFVTCLRVCSISRWGHSLISLQSISPIHKSRSCCLVYIPRSTRAVFLIIQSILSICLVRKLKTLFINIHTWATIEAFFLFCHELIYSKAINFWQNSCFSMNSHCNTNFYIYLLEWQNYFYFK